MSGESIRHVRLVELLIDTVEKRHTTDRGIVVLADHHRYGCDRPPMIGGFTPDLFASDVPATFRVVGEAKTYDDLATERSRRQIAAFLDHLSLYSGSVLYIAVPWRAVPKARFLLKTLRRTEHQDVATEILAHT